MTVAPHPFDVPLDEPLDDLGPALPSAPAADGDDVLEGEVHGQEGEAEQQHVDGAEVDPEGGEEPDGGGEDGEESHGALVPPDRPLDPAQLRRALTAWCDHLASFDDRAVGLHQVQEAGLALGEVEQELTDRLVEELTEPWVETPAGILKRDRRGGHVSWDPEAIWPEALAEARRRCANPETGELSPDADRGARAMLDVVKEVLSSPSFRVKQLKAIGVDPDEVRATAPKRKIVRFVS